MHLFGLANWYLLSRMICLGIAEIVYIDKQVECFIYVSCVGCIW
jgi:hypothetical protein